MALSTYRIANTLDGRRHRRALRTPLPEVATHLQHLLSLQLTAVMANQHDTQLIADWASGDLSIRNPEAERRLRAAYEISLLLLEAESPGTVHAWFMGMNPQLDDRSAVEVIADGRLGDAFEAAHYFTSEG